MATEINQDDLFMDFEDFIEEDEDNDEGGRGEDEDDSWEDATTSTSDLPDAAGGPAGGGVQGAPHVT